MTWIHFSKAKTELESVNVINAKYKICVKSTQISYLAHNTENWCLRWVAKWGDGWLSREIGD
jgi:hypothetical protein